MILNWEDAPGGSKVARVNGETLIVYYDAETDKHKLKCKMRGGRTERLQLDADGMTIEQAQTFAARWYSEALSSVA